MGQGGTYYMLLQIWLNEWIQTFLITSLTLQDGALVGVCILLSAILVSFLFALLL